MDCRCETHNGCVINRNRHVVPRIGEKLSQPLRMDWIVKHALGDMVERCPISLTENTYWYGHELRYLTETYPTSGRCVIMNDQPLPVDFLHDQCKKAAQSFLFHFHLETSFHDRVFVV